MVYTIYADGVLDQHCETEAQMKKEKKDLQKMGHKVTVKSYKSWKEAEAAEDKYNARR